MKKPSLSSFALAAMFTTGAIVGGYVVAVVLDALGREIKEGDLIQWECNGKYMFPAAKRVARIENSEHGVFLFVEGEKTGIPIAEAQKVNIPAWDRLTDIVKSV